MDPSNVTVVGRSPKNVENIEYLSPAALREFIFATGKKNQNVLFLKIIEKKLRVILSFCLSVSVNVWVLLCVYVAGNCGNWAFPEMPRQFR
jgi:hypothetical protein